MFDPDSIRIQDYDYPLPDEKIARFPMPLRDASKLLIYQQGLITEDVFSNIDQHLPGNSLLIFNNTRVIHARLIFLKPTGAQVEIFCLEPLSPTCEIQAAFHQQAASTWKCLVGNLKKWKSGTLMLEYRHEHDTHQLFASLIRSCGDGSYEIAFRWNPPEKTFSEILDLMGQIPLPPYINRAAELLDNERYQTIYAEHDGSVAAPTAGLHFTAPLLEKVRAKGIETENVTLHVGVGTFRPVGAGNISDHVMHREKIVVPRKIIERLLGNLKRPVFAVGTTSARTLESLYWLGVKLIAEGPWLHPAVLQWDPYNLNPTANITVQQSLSALLRYMMEHQLEAYSGETQLMIVPGYQYRLISGIITNFHMPQSTLLLLVAAMIGNGWRTAYDYALQNDFRFLSYGDSCLFFITPFQLQAENLL